MILLTNTTVNITSDAALKSATIVAPIVTVGIIISGNHFFPTIIMGIIVSGKVMIPTTLPTYLQEGLHLRLQFH